MSLSREGSELILSNEEIKGPTFCWDYISIRDQEKIESDGEKERRDIKMNEKRGKESEYLFHIQYIIRSLRKKKIEGLL